MNADILFCFSSEQHLYDILGKRHGRRLRFHSFTNEFSLYDVLDLNDKMSWT